VLKTKKIHFYYNNEINQILVEFFELFASFSCTQNWNRIPNTIPVPETPNKYRSAGSGSGSATLHMRELLQMVDK
jgi:hypothetical protein